MKARLFLTFWTGAIAITMMSAGAALAQREGSRDGNPAGPAGAPTNRAGGIAAPDAAPHNDINRNARENQARDLNDGPRNELGNRDRREGEMGRSEDWRTRWSDGRWWYWGPDNRWSYWNDGQWTNYEEAAMGSGDQSGQTAPQGYGGDGCGCAAAAPAPAPAACSSGCASSCSSCGSEESCGCRHRHRHHRHRSCCG